MATTPSPTPRSADLPMVAGVRPETPSALITAVSVSGSVPRTLALARVPSLKETVMLPASPATSTTWLLVRICAVGAQDDARARARPPGPPSTSILTTRRQHLLGHRLHRAVGRGGLATATTPARSTPGSPPTSRARAVLGGVPRRRRRRCRPRRRPAGRWRRRRRPDPSGPGPCARGAARGWAAGAGARGRWAARAGWGASPRRSTRRRHAGTGCRRRVAGAGGSGGRRAGGSVRRSCLRQCAVTLWMP